MPLSVTDATDTNALKEKFLIFYSSYDENGKLWCPDCIAVQDLIQATFAPDDAPEASIVYVGQKAEWKTPSNIFRSEPWRIQCIPTIVRVRDDARLVDTQIKEHLSSFIRG
jgi:hypothetical protein